MVETFFALGGAALAERVFFAPSSQPHSLLVLTALFLLRFCIFFVLTVAALIDLDEMLVPNFVWKFAALPILAALVLPVMAPSVDVYTALAGAGLGYFGLRLLFIDGFELLTGKRGMGLGDAEVLALVGALLGPAGVLFSLGAGAIQGVAAALIARVLGVRIGPDHGDEVEDELEDDRAQEHTATPTVADEPAQSAGATPADTLQPIAATDGAAERDDSDRSVPLKVPFVPFLAIAAIEYLLGADALVTRWLSPM
jgi:prepilin signal peptidase PulO-like enzyme (type II secretory pathway)